MASVWLDGLFLPGVGVGEVTHADAGTGLTVIVLPAGARGAVHIAGGAPATRETPVLEPDHLVPGPDAVVLTGGSAFGLRTAEGVMAALAARRRGFHAGRHRVPIVVAAALFDLAFGRPEIPSAEDGRQAAIKAWQGLQTVPAGSYGAGSGATVGKLRGPDRAMKGGQAGLTLVTSDGLRVGVLVVVNAVGSVVDAPGRLIAGPLGDDGRPDDMDYAVRGDDIPFGQSTTLGVVITNAGLSKAELLRVAKMAHAGLARTIRPVHTPWDGDALFAVSVGSGPASAGRVGMLGADLVASAVIRAVRSANAGT
ncbi:MAG: P1 family peptidase [Sulfobacillus sp.]|nr:P1 family peptidase [Sulfobacillus sp.]